MGAERAEAAAGPSWMRSSWFAAIVMIICVPLSLALYGAFIQVAADLTDPVAWVVLAVTVAITVGFFSFQPKENGW